MEILGFLAVLASLSAAAQCLQLQSRRQLGGYQSDPSEARKPLRNNNTKKRSASLPARAPPPYTETTEYAGMTHCLVSQEFMVETLEEEFPEHDFVDSLLGLELSDSMGKDECASICAQITGCNLFSCNPDSDSLCFIYATCKTPMNLGRSYTLYTLVGSKGDPHLRNLAGEKFDVNQPADYLLLRVPREPTEPALLAMRGYIGVAEDAVCALYMKEVTLSGKWLGTQQLQVRSLKGKSFEGTWPNGWPFAMRTFSTSVKSEGQWRSWENFTAEGIPAETLPGAITVTTVFRKEEAAAGGVMEAQAFEFRVGTQIARERASILIAQGSHEGLDISLSKMSMFHEREFGGLLGTDKHDKKVEVRTDECEASRGKARMAPSMHGKPVGSVFTASWG